MIPRYSRPEMARIWSDENRFATWLRVEIAATEVLAERGRRAPRRRWPPSRRRRASTWRASTPSSGGPARRHRLRLQRGGERRARGPLAALRPDLVRRGGHRARHAHARRLRPHPRRTCDALRTRSGARAHELKDTPMIGRTHGVHAEPMTFGLKLALWYAELRARPRARSARARETIAVGKLSGAVGTFSHLPPEVEEAVCARLGLRPAPIASQVLQRDRHAEVMTALAITGGQPGEVRDRDPRPAEDRGARGGGAVRREARRARRPCPTSATRWAASRSPASPAWCARNALAALENVALWHERDISHSSVERVIVPDSFLALDHMLRRMTDIVSGHGREHRAHAAEPRLDARPRLLRPAPPGADRARACAARTPTASCRATPWRPGRRRATSAPRVAADPEVRAVAEASRDSTRCSASSATSATWTRSSRGCSARRRAAS